MLALRGLLLDTMRNLFFFFQAEDGIRDYKVTGVQTCALPIFDTELGGKMEPRASRPAARLQAIRTLSAAGVPVGVMVAPVIPGLTDHEMPSIQIGRASCRERV